MADTERSDFSQKLRAVRDVNKWSDRDLGSKLRVSDQVTELWLEGKNLPVPSIRRRINTWAEKELSTKAEALVSDVQEAVKRHEEEGKPVSETLFQRTIFEGKTLLGWSTQRLADNYRVPGQFVERWIDGTGSPTDAIRTRLTESMADKVADHYDIKPPQQEEGRT